MLNSAIILRSNSPFKSIFEFIASLIVSTSILKNVTNRYKIVYTSANSSIVWLTVDKSSSLYWSIASNNSVVSSITLFLIKARSSISF